MNITYYRARNIVADKIRRKFDKAKIDLVELFESAKPCRPQFWEEEENYQYSKKWIKKESNVFFHMGEYIIWFSIPIEGNPEGAEDEWAKFVLAVEIYDPDRYSPFAAKYIPIAEASKQSAKDLIEWIFERISEIPKDAKPTKEFVEIVKLLLGNYP
jgi:hypothetical protein|nr:MAG TPA: hypothetical protein [Bacteriophage sp.]